MWSSQPSGRRSGPRVRPRQALADAGNGGEKLLGVRVLGRVEDCPHVGLLHELALVHHRDTVGEVRDDSHVVRDEDDGGAKLVAHPAQEVENLGLHGHIESGGGLVGDDDARVQTRAPAR